MTKRPAVFPSDPRPLAGTLPRRARPALNATLAAKPAAQAPVPPRRGPRLTADHGLGALGLMLALTTGGFATYMVSRSHLPVSVPGSEHLTVFAQLSGPGRVRVEQAPARPDDGLDPIVTGSIPTATPAANAALRGAGGPAPPKATLKNFTVRGLSRGTALVAGREGAWRVRPGSVIPEAGRVIAIERQGDTWVVFTSSGIIEGKATE